MSRQLEKVVYMGILTQFYFCEFLGRSFSIDTRFIVNCVRCSPAFRAGPTFYGSILPSFARSARSSNTTLFSA